MSEEVNLSSEERTRTLIDVEYQEMALDMMAKSKQLGAFNHELNALRDQANLVAAKQMQAEGRFNEIRATFWMKARKELSEWFAQVAEAGLTVTWEREKDPDTQETIGIKLVARDPQEEALKQMRRMFRGIQENRGGEGPDA